MALIIGPHNSNMASGKVGALVASRNRTGTYMRMNGKPIRPNTERQTKIKYDFTAMNRRFLNLTVEQQTQWRQFSVNYTVPNRLGLASNLTALNWFIALNTRLFDVGASLLVVPPTNPNSIFTPFISIAQFGAGSYIQMELNQGMSLAGYVRVQSSGAVLKSRNFLAQSTRLLTLVQNLPAMTPITLVAANDINYGGDPAQTAYQFIANAVDTFGRSTPELRFTVYPQDS